MSASINYTLDRTAPSAPSVLAITTPTTSTGIDTNIVVTVSGLESGSTVKVYSDSSCSSGNLKGTGSASSSTSAAIGEDNSDISAHGLDTAASASAAIDELDVAIKTLAEAIQAVGDNQARLSSKEESLSTAISNTEASRSRIEDADFAKEQMNMMKLQILQQTTVSSFTQANTSAQVVLSLFR